MSAPPLSVVPVFIALVLHLTDGAEPLSAKARCFAGGTVTTRATACALQVAGTDLDDAGARHWARTPLAEAVPGPIDGARRTGQRHGRARLTLPVAGDRPEFVERPSLLEAKVDRTPAVSTRAADPRG